MDELNNKLQAEGVPAAEPPREVVLRYDAPSPEPVVERYVHPEPLPGRRKAAAKPPVKVPAKPPVKTPAKPPKRGRWGLRVFLLCAAVLLASSLGKAMLRRTIRDLLQKYEQDAPRVEYYAERPTGSGAETALPRCRGGGDVRLRFSETRGEALTIQQVYERVNPCTVTVVVAVSDLSAYVGTGVIFTEDGYILTNAHVVQGGTEAAVALDDGTVYRDARLVGMDETNDLAVLKIDAHGLPVAEFGDSDALSVGDTVYAIGNPLGLELRGTLTDGIVSAINRDVVIDGVVMTLIQTNAALNNGNSGGPLINIYGQVVGVNTMKMGSHTGGRSTVSVEGLGFAIPISSAAWIVDDLIAYGELRGEPVLGMLVEEGALPSGERAVVIREVTKGGAADAAGIREDDAIVAAEGEAVETTADLLRIRRRFRAGETMTLTIDRDGERFDAELTLRAA